MGQEIPSAWEYKEAFRASASLSPIHMKLLRSHYAETFHIVTATRLSDAVGFKDYRGANLQYGKLGRQIGELISWQPETWLEVLVTIERPVYEPHPMPGHVHEVCWKMRPQVAQALEELGWVEGKASPPVEEISSHMTLLSEGEAHQVDLTRYERNPEIRRRCIKHYGAKCYICEFDFGEIYGEMADGYIHVHHLRLLSADGSKHEVNPVEDLLPVCPNCHVILHLRTPPFSVEKIKSIVRERRRD